MLDQALRGHAMKTPWSNCTPVPNSMGATEGGRKRWPRPWLRARDLVAETAAGRSRSSIRQALTTHPGDPALNSLLAQAQQLLAEQQRKESIARLIQEINGRLASGQLELAEASLEDGAQAVSGRARFRSVARAYRNGSQSGSPPHCRRKRQTIRRRFAPTRLILGKRSRRWKPPWRRSPATNWQG